MDTNNRVCYENWGMGSHYAIGWAGSGYYHGGGNPGSSFWFIHELWYDGPSGQFGGSCYDDSGNLIAGSTFSYGGSGVNVVDCFGFGNWDVNHSTETIRFQYDWVSWSVNEPLPDSPKLIIEQTDGGTEVNEAGVSSDSYTVVLYLHLRDLQG